VHVGELQHAIAPARTLAKNEITRQEFRCFLQYRHVRILSGCGDGSHKAVRLFCRAERAPNETSEQLTTKPTRIQSRVGYLLHQVVVVLAILREVQPQAISHVGGNAMLYFATQGPGKVPLIAQERLGMVRAEQRPILAYGRVRTGRVS
jgi:hypothetical protein